jgi:hypothetical protein
MADTPDRPEPSDAAPEGRPAPDAFGRRPLIERLGLAVIALGLGALFAVVGIASFVGGEPFLGVMGLIGCLMVLWVGGLTLFRG